jgi:hypothetical protein
MITIQIDMSRQTDIHAMPCCTTMQCASKRSRMVKERRWNGNGKATLRYQHPREQLVFCVLRSESVCALWQCHRQTRTQTATDTQRHQHRLSKALTCLPLGERVRSLSSRDRTVLQEVCFSVKMVMKIVEKDRLVNYRTQTK